MINLFNCELVRRLVDLAYTVMVHDCGIEVVIFGHGPIDHVRYDDRKGWPDACELHACPRTADKS